MAILDFDVHHGNGTQACVVNAIPSVLKCTIQTPLGNGVQLFPAYKPWLSSEDVDNIFFARYDCPVPHVLLSTMGLLGSESPNY